MGTSGYNSGMRDLLDFSSAFDELFDSLPNSRKVTTYKRTVNGEPEPTVKTYVKDEKTHCEIELPGYAKSDISVKVDGNRLDVVAKNESRGERTSKFTLFDNADVKGITSSFKDGLLAIVIPATGYKTLKSDIPID